MTGKRTGKALDDQFRERCRNIAEELPEGWHRYDQAIGTVPKGGWSEFCGCVGVHLHAILEPEGVPGQDGRKRRDYYVYERGQSLCADHLGIDPGTLEDQLFLAGAPAFPFGQESWERHPRQVFEAMASLTEISVLTD